MPTAAPHGCSYPRCGALVPRGKSRCAEHERAVEAERGSSTERGYNGAWRRYRLTFLAEHPLCELCLQEGRLDPLTGETEIDASGKPVCGPVPAGVVDHIQAHKGDQVLFWAKSNHRSLCTPHHNKIVSQGDFGR